MIFVTEMDQDDVSYREVVEQLTELIRKTNRIASYASAQKTVNL